MATVDARIGAVGTKPHANSTRRMWCEDFVIDYSSSDITGTAGTVNQIINIPANVRVEGIAWEVTTAEGATLTFDIGDADTADGYVDNANGNTLGSGTSQFQILTEAAPNTMGALFGNGKFYSAAGILSITNVDAAATAVIRVVAYGVDCT